MIRDNEGVYDALISPLMTQIIAVCKEHQIPLAFQCQYSEDGLVSTLLPVDGQSSEHQSVHVAIQRTRRAQTSALHLRIDHGDGTQTLETIIA